MLQLLLDNIDKKSKEDKDKQDETNKTIMKTMTDAIAALSKPSKKYDLDKSCKLSLFKGHDGKFNEWIIKLKAQVTTQVKGSDAWMGWAMNMTPTKEMPDATELNIDEKWGPQMRDDVKEFSAQIFKLLVNITEDEPFKICNAAPSGEGLEVLRLLRKRYDPRTPGTKRALLKVMMNITSCKKLGDVQQMIMKVEALVKKYDELAGVGSALPEDLVVTMMIEVCSKELREHLELSTKDMKIDEVREEIMNYVERKRANAGAEFDTVEMSALKEEWQGQGHQVPHGHQGHEEELDWYGNHDWGSLGGYYDEPEEISFFYSKGSGKKGGKSDYGKGGKSYGKGDYGKSYGKGDYGKSYGKGDYGKSYGKGSYGKGDSGKGEGKGKGKGFQGDCHWCGKYGHSQRDCREKDTYMQNLRDKKANGQGADGVQEEAGSIEKFEEQVRNRGGVHDLCSIQIANKFEVLSREQDEEYPPPGLNQEPKNLKMPQMPKIQKTYKKKVRFESIKEVSNLEEIKEQLKPKINKCESTIKEKMNKNKTKGTDNPSISQGMSRKYWKTPPDMIDPDDFDCEWTQYKNSPKDEAKEYKNYPKDETKEAEKEKRDHDLRSGEKEDKNVLKEVSNVEDEDEYIQVTIDSGASDSVMPEALARKCPMRSSPGSRLGVKYIAAAGKVIYNQGQKHVQVETDGGYLCSLTMQITGVNKALMSVSKICDSGHEVIFTSDGGRMVNKASGQVVPFKRVDGVYRMRLRVIGESPSVFPRPGK